MTASSSAPDIPDPVSILETMRLEHGAVIRIDRHLSRGRRTAASLGYPWHDAEIAAALATACGSAPTGVWRVRLLVDSSGKASVTCTAHRDSDAVWRIAFAHEAVDSADPRLPVKTTNRGPYDRARRSRPDVDDVVLWNERSEVTESTIANIVADFDGEKCTPAASSGLLPGVLRGELLGSGQIVERVITRGMLARAERVWLVNSLRGWIEATLVR